MQNPLTLNHSKNIILSLVLGLLMTACATDKLSYSIDPEISNIQKLADHVSLVSLSVIDNRQTNPPPFHGKTLLGPDTENETNAIKASLINTLKNNNFKIISKPLLADLALELKINQFTATIEENFFQSEIEVISHFQLKATRRGKSVENLHKMTLTKSVANPATQNDVTGVVNQLLSKQLSTLLTDNALIELAKKQ